MRRFGDPMVRARAWQAVRILGACALAYGATGILGLPEGYWAVITTIVVTQADFGATLQAGRDRIFGTIIGASAGLLVIAASRQGFPLARLFWIALVPLAVLTAVKPNLRLSCVTLVVVVLVPSASQSLWYRPIDRIIEILIGTVASIVMSAILFPKAIRANAAEPASGDKTE